LSKQLIRLWPVINDQSGSPQNWGVRGANPKTSCPHPQPLSQLWERAEEDIKNPIPPRIGGLGGNRQRGEENRENTDKINK